MSKNPGNALGKLKKSQLDFAENIHINIPQGDAIAKAREAAETRKQQNIVTSTDSDQRISSKHSSVGKPESVAKEQSTDAVLGSAPVIWERTNRRGLVHAFQSSLGWFITNKSEGTKNLEQAEQEVAKLQINDPSIISSSKKVETKGLELAGAVDSLIGVVESGNSKSIPGHITIVERKAAKFDAVLAAFQKKLSKYAPNEIPDCLVNFANSAADFRKNASNCAKAAIVLAVEISWSAGEKFAISTYNLSRGVKNYIIKPAAKGAGALGYVPTVGLSFCIATAAANVSSDFFQVAKIPFNSIYNNTPSAEQRKKAREAMMTSGIAMCGYVAALGQTRDGSVMRAINPNVALYNLMSNNNDGMQNNSEPGSRRSSSKKA